MTRTTSDGERPVERRLRQALEARAAGVDVRRLRPADPPGPRTRRLPAAWLRLRSFTLPLAGLAAAAAAVVGYLVFAPEASPVRPLPPASPPELITPAPAPTPESEPASQSSPPTPFGPTPFGPTPSGSRPSGPTPSRSTPSRQLPSATPSPSWSPPPSGSRSPAPSSLSPSARPGGAVPTESQVLSSKERR